MGILVTQKYKICYFKANGIIEKEYPLSFDLAWLRKEYLEKFIRGYVWLEEVNHHCPK